MQAHRPRARRAALLAVGALTLTLGVAPSGGGVGAATPAGSAKRGIASSSYLHTAPGKLPAAGARWAYAWTTQVPYSTLSLETVPMIWNTKVATTGYMLQLGIWHALGRYTHLLGFNEPDARTQANMTPQQAADLWPTLMGTGLVLGSPAPAVVGDGWLRRFMALVAARHLRVDFIALHFYARLGDRSALARIQKQVALVRRHYGRPIWVTEIGLLDSAAVPARAKSATAVRFLRSVSALFDRLPYVERYAWMTDRIGRRSHLAPSTLYDGAGRLTALGRAYRDLP